MQMAGIAGEMRYKQVKERKGKELTSEKLREILYSIYPEHIAEELFEKLAGNQAARRIKEVSDEMAGEVNEGI